MQDSACLLPSPCRANQPIGHQAEPEIDHHTHVKSKGLVSGHCRQGWGQHEIHDISQHHSQQSLNDIYQHG
jgi:hypothetical protein